MSRSFLGFGQTQYIGIPQTQPIKIAGIAGQVIPLVFPWLAYGAATAKPNINVLVDMQGAACRALDQIRSVYIDNLGSSNPTYVYFPDTGYSIAAKANSEGWYPAFTNSKVVWVIGQGFLDGSIPQTFILLSNFPIVPSVNTELDQSVALWKASAVISRGTSIYNANLGAPALGDQLSYNAFQANIPGTLPLFGTPSTGFIYITAIAVIAVGLNNGSITTVQQLLESTGAAGILYNFQITLPAGAFPTFPAYQPLMQLSGMQIKLDATQTWRLRNTGTGPGGFIEWYIHYTTNPT